MLSAIACMKKNTRQWKDEWEKPTEYLIGLVTVLEFCVSHDTSVSTFLLYMCFRLFSSLLWFFSWNRFLMVLHHILWFTKFSFNPFNNFSRSAASPTEVTSLILIHYELRLQSQPKKITTHYALAFQLVI